MQCQLQRPTVLTWLHIMDEGDDLKQKLGALLHAPRVWWLFKWDCIPYTSTYVQLTYPVVVVVSRHRHSRLYSSFSPRLWVDRENIELQINTTHSCPDIDFLSIVTLLSFLAFTPHIHINWLPCPAPHFLWQHFYKNNNNMKKKRMMMGNREASRSPRQQMIHPVFLPDERSSESS